ncbi:MAG: hypothetical protein V1933_04890 [Candidatus Omnitrophota bacterium]
MKTALKKFSLAAGIVLIFSVLAGSINAAEQQNESGFVKFWRGAFQWPFNATKESATVVTDTAKKGVDTIAQEGKDIGGTLTGQEGAAKDIVVNPVKGTADTVETAVVGAANMPAEATKESWPSEKQP